MQTKIVFQYKKFLAESDTGFVRDISVVVCYTYAYTPADAPVPYNLDHGIKVLLSRSLLREQLQQGIRDTFTKGNAFGLSYIF
jgi:hypothetical protein